ncbi:MAG TPA: tRNA (adenosine(37)-N6)-threonylcarbamoyltransferase complex dimerization subunit type 1 TsaB [Tepidisphaeraceae bacterium]|jgi:tRNA threonylcarbamoyladenosine biosynthesis protein TsaB|nr:tRNA (adenosine(37)-N6)-threonylcarbamoyltransferase complex dimerization subunit type 1 TsaB [Tepidisphaeraceae bacterium]
MTIRALAIETSGRIGSVALAEDGKTLLDETFPHGLQHAARIVPALDHLCKQLKWTSSDIKEIYVSAGPGSFTGLRIGITLAKTLALVTGAALVAVPSVSVLAENAPPGAKNIVIVLDAKRDQVFTASFVRTGQEWIPVEPAQLSSLAEILSKTPRPVHLIGEGIPYHRKFIPAGDAEIHIADEPLWRARASAVATLGWRMARAGQFTDAMSLCPIYIRRPEAEEKLDP